MMKKVITILSFMGLFACNSKYSRLADYYKDNHILHRQMGDSLLEFCKRMNCRVIMRKSAYENEVFFRYWVMNDSEGKVIVYDSLLMRKDPYPEQTLKVVIPPELVVNFKKSIYPSLKADNSEVFFGYKYYANGNSQYGILVIKEKESIKQDYIILLDSSACITKSIIP